MISNSKINSQSSTPVRIQSPFFEYKLEIDEEIQPMISPANEKMDTVADLKQILEYPHVFVHSEFEISQSIVTDEASLEFRKSLPEAEEESCEYQRPPNLDINFHASDEESFHAVSTPTFANKEGTFETISELDQPEILLNLEPVQATSPSEDVDKARKLKSLANLLVFNTALLDANHINQTSNEKQLSFNTEIKPQENHD